MHLSATAYQWHSSTSVGMSDLENVRPAVTSSHFWDLNGFAAMESGLSSFAMRPPFPSMKKATRRWPMVLLCFV